MSSISAVDPSHRADPISPDRKAIDIGSYHTDTTLIASHFGWRPKVRYAAGFAQTLAYYEQAMPYYVDPDDPLPACSLLHCTKSKAAAPLASR